MPLADETASKIVSVDEVVRSNPYPKDSESDKAFLVEMLTDIAEWQDDTGHKYVSEKNVRTLFNSLAQVMEKKHEPELRERFEAIQKVMDTKEDHSPKLAAGKLKRNPSYRY